MLDIPLNEPNALLFKDGMEPIAGRGPSLLIKLIGSSGLLVLLLLGEDRAAGGGAGFCLRILLRRR